MQLLRSATKLSGSAQQCAALAMVGGPALMRFVIEHMRSNRDVNLTVQQFRTLVFARVEKEPTLSPLAEMTGLSLPAASRMVDQLVRRGLMVRRPHREDRRRVLLALTRRGERVFQAADRATRAALARRFERLSTADQRLVGRAMQVLAELFVETAPAHERRSVRRRAIEGQR